MTTFDLFNVFFKVRGYLTNLYPEIDKFVYVNECVCGWVIDKIVT